MVALFKLLLLFAFSLVYFSWFLFGVSGGYPTAGSQRLLSQHQLHVWNASEEKGFVPGWGGPCTGDAGDNFLWMKGSLPTAAATAAPPQPGASGLQEHQWFGFTKRSWGLIGEVLESACCGPVPWG